MSRANPDQELVDSDASDPTFEPSLDDTSSPEQKSSTQVQQQSNRHGQTQLNTTTRFRSSPPVIASSSSRLPQQRSQAQAQERSSQPSKPQVSSPQDGLQLLHPGPFTSSPPPLSPLRTQQSRAHSQSQSPSKLISPSLPPNHPKLSRPLRPNTYLGPPSTWRAWTKEDRAVAQSLERARGQDLSIHLYNAYILQKKAERAKAHSGSRSRSQSRNRRKTTDAKGKGRARADAPSSPAPERDEQSTFEPPRVWTAWPLPRSEVPREELLPTHTVLDGYRRQRDARPSAELEECLLAVTSRLARQRWEAREWASESEEEEADQQIRKKRKVVNPGVKDESIPVDTDVEMEDDHASTSQDDHLDDNSSNHTSSLSPSPAHNPDIPMFSSQLFRAPSPSPTLSSSTSSPPPSKPTFLADDDRLRQLLLPSTRHVISQLDELLGALHAVNSHRRRKSVAIGVRGWEEVIGIAGAVFDSEVVERARGRCERIFNDSTG